MENMQVESPFKSPEVNNLSLRHRLGSGSSVSSTERDSPHRRLNNVHHNTATAISTIGDENSPPTNLSADGNDRVNPFEKDVLSGLQKSFWSPSIMEIKETPPQRSWAIEHLSHLFPKDIENSPSTHQNAFPIDAQTEAKAQADIDAYFNRGPIVPTPSPMKQRVLYNEVARLNKTAIPYVHCGQSPVGRGVAMSLSSSSILYKKNKKTTPLTERWTQTTLSFPENLPPQIEELLSQFCLNDDLCGSSSETSAFCSQKSEASEHEGCVDNNDSGKNSSYLNNSIRRRLDLSFGEDNEGECSNGLPSGPLSPIVDPFRRNHVVSTPPAASNMNTTTTELEIQFMRCEFTPETRGNSAVVTPGITPIQDNSEDGRFNSNSCSTPRRTNSNLNPRRAAKGFIVPVSPMQEPVQLESNVNVQALRRCYPGSSEPTSTKTCSAFSFDDSQLQMNDSSPPSKLYRRNLDDNTS